MNWIEPFCSNPDCELHVHAGSPGVVGWGNWAEMPDGRIIGRGLYCHLFWCDSCRREWRAVAAFILPPVGN